MVTEGATGGRRIAPSGLADLRPWSRPIRAWLADPVVVLNAIRVWVEYHAQKALGRRRRDSPPPGRMLAADGRVDPRAIVTKLQVHSDRVNVTLDQMSGASWLNTKDQRDLRAGRNDRERYMTILTIPARLKSTGIEMRLVVDDGFEPAKVILVWSVSCSEPTSYTPPARGASLPLKEIAARRGSAVPTSRDS